jgi:hypothetical protein
MRWSQSFRLVAADLWVEVRLTHIDGRWIASADTNDGPSLGLGYLPTEALEQALAPFEGAIDDLMRGAPEIPYWR